VLKSAVNRREIMKITAGAGLPWPCQNQDILLSIELLDRGRPALNACNENSRDHYCGSTWQNLFATPIVVARLPCSAPTASQ
jgi:hypothetical protein